MEHLKFPKIEQFRHTVKQVRDSVEYGERLPVIFFTGYVKLHGTNASVVYSKDTGLYVQSRRNIITPTDDNYGFAAFVEANKDFFMDYISKYNISDNTIITIAGEWAGKGIQNGVGISELDKSFFIFEVNERDVDPLLKDIVYDKHIIVPAHDNIYSIEEFYGIKFSIDFNNIDGIEQSLQKIIQEVEDECPVTKQLTGKVGIGEGMVFTGYNNGVKYRFKVKGEKHQSSGPKVKVAIDATVEEAVTNFIEYVATENRFNQCLFELNIENPEFKDIPHISKWMYNDIVSEENDVMIEQNIEPKMIGKKLSLRIKDFIANHS